MKKIIYTLWFLFIALALVGCDRNEDDLFVEEIVVDGFLYVNHPLSINLTHTVPIKQYYDPDAVRVSGADVRITVDNHEFHLIEQLPAKPGTYSLPADSHIVTTGKRYDLWLAKNGTVITATTVAAAALQIDSTNLENTGPTNPDTIEYGDTEFYFHWNEDPANFGYFIIMENIEPDWFNVDREVSGDNGPNETNLSAIPLRDTDEFTVPWIFYGYTGTHRIRVLSCGQALWDYVNTTLLGEAENYPVTNLSQGRGVFCAAGADTVYFELVDVIED